MSQTPGAGPSYTVRTPSPDPDIVQLHAAIPEVQERELRIRTLEKKVAFIVSKKCSLREVQELYQELQECLESDLDHAPPTLRLSSLLINAILANHLTFSDALREAKGIEASLREQVATLERRVERLEEEKGGLEMKIYEQKHQYSQKAQETLNLRAELNRAYASSTVPVPANGSYSSTSRVATPSNPRAPSSMGSSATQPIPFSRPRTASISIASQRAQTPGMQSRTSTPAVGSYPPFAGASVYSQVTAAAAGHSRTRSTSTTSNMQSRTTTPANASYPYGAPSLYSKMTGQGGISASRAATPAVASSSRTPMGARPAP